MKDHPERQGRLQLIEAMFAGYSWQAAVAQSQLHISRSTAYRLRQLAREEDEAELAFLDDRHGHPYKLLEPARTWLAECCTTHPQVASSRVQAELKTTFGVTVSVSQINRVRAKLGISTQRRGQIQGQTKKNAEWQTCLDSRCTLRWKSWPFCEPEQKRWRDEPLDPKRSSPPP